MLSKKTQSKGARLKWSSFKDSKSVLMDETLFVGKKLSEADLNKRAARNKNPESVILIP